MRRPRPSSTSRLIFLGAITLTAFAHLTACDRSPETAPVLGKDPTPVRFVGRETCAKCHQTQNDLFTDSHHDLAMEPASPETVLGDFNNATLEHFGSQARFFTRDGTYFVKTEDAEGTPREFAVDFTFGVEPLQQYLVSFPDGRKQALPFAWDTRPAEQGGQRWFHLYPHEAIPAGDPLHWTGPNQNWNFMCAECHSTDLRKHYTSADDTYHTTWSEIDVSCEACHGPGSAHVAWASGDHKDPADPTDTGLFVDLRDHDAGAWLFAPGEPIAHRSVPRTSHPELNACARCHSRRSVISPEYEHGRPILDTHRVSLLTSPEYFADGQMREETYVYGSFLQSRMHAAGVTCADCHEPHSTRLLADGNTLCIRCHAPEVFDTEAHSHHAVTTGVGCIDCHMPERTFMVVDARRDHSFRIPRPDLSLKLGTPNACTDCHTEQLAETADAWAAEHVETWYGTDRCNEWHYGEALHAAREHLPDATLQLERLTHDPAQPAIARATGLAAFTEFPGPRMHAAIDHGLTDPDPLVRLGAVEAIGSLPAGERVPLAGPLLTDAVRAVRIEAARVLAAAVPTGAVEPYQHEFVAAEAEYIAAQRANADRPEAHVALGVLHTDIQRFDEARAEYAAALAIDPAYTPASINLADVCRLTDDDARAEQVLRDALKRTPRDAAARHALGLTLVRLGRSAEARTELQRAAEWAPDEPRYSYVYAVALDSDGRTDEAIGVLRTAQTRSPWNREVLEGLVSMLRSQGRADEAEVYLWKLKAIER